ncbi:MAG: hypothetical protein R3288_07030, partial [Woeseiaceae bacterium]|nr:hypothetical protein [Woeseiaceae bacterium]
MRKSLITTCLVAGLGVLAAGQLGLNQIAGEPLATPATLAAPDRSAITASMRAEAVAAYANASQSEAAADVFAVPPVAVSNLGVRSTGDDLVGPPLAETAANRPESDRKPVSPRDKMSGPVAALAATGGNGMVEIIARYDVQPELFDDEYVAELGGKVTRRYATLDMRAITIPA